MKAYRLSLATPIPTKGFICRVKTSVQVCRGVGQAQPLLSLSSTWPLLDSSETSKKKPRKS